MSFGYGVGDVIAISRLAVKVYTAYKDAPDDYRNISDEVKSLDIIINNAVQHFESTTLRDSKRQEGQEILRGCQNVLEDLDSLIVKYKSLASAGSSQVIQRIKLGTEDIVTLRIRLISNTTLLNGFIQSCDSEKMQTQLNSLLGLRRTMSKDSIVSFAGSINTKKAYKKFCKGLFDIGVTADVLKQNEKDIQDMLKLATSNKTDDSSSGSTDPNQPPEVGASSRTETSPISTTILTENPRSRSRFGWARAPIDFLVGPLMLSAAEAGNTKRLISTLAFVQNIDFADGNGETALHEAASSGHKDAVEVLLSKGASVGAMNIYGNTPLHYTVLNGDIGTVELLLSNGASVEAVNTTGDTPLHYAACTLWGGHTGIVELLLSKGASIAARDHSNKTPLHYAAWTGNTGIVELLLSKGASIAARDEDNKTPLDFATLYGRTDIMRLLQNKAAELASHGNIP